MGSVEQQDEKSKSLKLAEHYELAEEHCKPSRK